jgi:RND superfamily putative drug exporter
VAAARPVRASRAIAFAIIGIAALAVIAVPSASLRLGLPLGSADNPDTTQHKAYDLIGEKFGQGANGPLLVVADLPAGTTEAQLLDAEVTVAKRLAGFDGVVAVALIGASADRTVTAFEVLPEEGPSSVSTEQLVQAIRAASPLKGGVAIGVAGQTTGNIDISQKLADALPLYMLVVVGLSLLIMVVVFRSLLLPLVATGGFVLSYFAALGGVVAIYQWGWFGAISGVATPAPILDFLPTILFGILFGLAMDYTLFLASGMREAYAHGAPSKTAVVLGLRAGRAVVIAAAIIMTSVFGSFVLSDSAIIRPIGFALAFGVLVDAFLVRLLILPALMTLAGDWAWWLPRWLDRLLPNVDVEGASLERRHPHVAADHLEPA